MDVQMIREALETVLNEAVLEDTALDGLRLICSFDEAGILSRDEGLVLQTQDGREFQITIRQSR